MEIIPYINIYLFVKQKTKAELLEKNEQKYVQEFKEKEEFLRKEFKNKLSEEIIDKAIAENPMKAKIKSDFIDKIADDVIKFERIQVSGISAALSIPGGLSVVATIPVDMAIISYFCTDFVSEFVQPYAKIIVFIWLSTIRFRVRSKYFGFRIYEGCNNMFRDNVRCWYSKQINS